MRRQTWEIRAVISIDLEPEIERRLALVAGKTGQSVSGHLRKAILDHLEDLGDGFVALERLQVPGKLHSAAEVRLELGL